jgi:hypothetical protein
VSPRRLVALLALSACDGTTLTFTDASRDAPLDASDVATGPSGVGLRCSDERELTEVLFGCRGGQTCYTSGRGFPFGYCTQTCRGAPCPADGVCVAQGGAQFCLRRCARDSECRTDQGYVCARPGAGLDPACVPDPSPLGTRSGAACGPTEVIADAGVLDESVSHAREDSDLEIDPTLARSPRTSTLIAAFEGRFQGRDLSGLLARARGMSWDALNPLRDRDFENVTGAVVAFDDVGALFASWKAESFDRPSVRVRLARSVDEGDSFTAVSADDESLCAAGCSAPALTAWGDGEAAVAFVTQGNGRLVLRRGHGGGAPWDATVTLGEVETVRGGTLAPRSPALRPAEGGGAHAAWVVTRRENARAHLGDVVNEVRYARVRDGAGVSPERVSLPEGVVAHTPSLAAQGDRVHVAYVAGEGDGAWDVVLATRDGMGAWSRRRVHRDPRCATHGWPAAAVRADGDVQVLWLDNTAGEGAAYTARCPAEPARPCGEPQRLSSRGFRMNTSDEPTRTHGVTSAMVRGRDGTLHAAWSDTRTGGPSIWSARVP